jgi:hypothetical protein
MQEVISEKSIWYLDGMMVLKFTLFYSKKDSKRILWAVKNK